MADDDINRVADAADDVPFTAFVPRITGPTKAEEPQITAAQARELLAQAEDDGIRRSIRLIDSPDGLRYERIGDDAPLGPATRPGQTFEQALALACMRYDALEQERKAKIRALYPPRRAGQVMLGHAELHQLLGVPDGLRITGMRHDQALSQLILTVEGEALREVREGCEAPILAGHWDYTHVELPAGGEHDEEMVLSFGRLDWWSD